MFFEISIKPTIESYLKELGNNNSFEGLKKSIHFIILNCIKGEQGVIQFYFKEIPQHQRNFLVVSVLFNSLWLPRNFKNCPK